MKQIKTIVRIADAGPEVFDNDVNKALAEGWKLVKREVLPPEFSGDGYYKRRYYAELEKDEAPEVLVEASQELVEICKEMTEGIGELIGRFTDKLTPYFSACQRSCMNCKHRDLLPGEGPCRYCGDDCEDWEPRT